MGIRAHFAKTYKVEWDGGVFNYAAGSLYDYLTDNGLEDFHTSDEFDSYSEWEIDKSSLSAFIKREADKSPDEIVVERDEENQYTREEVLDTLQDWLEQAEPAIDYIKISWF